MVCFVAVWRSDSDTLFVFLRGKLQWIKKSVCYLLFKLSQAGFQWFLHGAAGEDGHRAQSEGGRVACGASAWTVSSKHVRQAAAPVWSWTFSLYISCCDVSFQSVYFWWEVSTVCSVVIKWHLMRILLYLYSNKRMFVCIKTNVYWMEPDFLLVKPHCCKHKHVNQTVFIGQISSCFYGCCYWFNYMDSMI